MGQISILIPARNAGATLPETLASVLGCSAVGQVIVIDDGSSDNTAACLAGYTDPRMKIVAGPQQGISAALNTGLDYVTCDYVARCDADDMIVPEGLENQLAWLQDHPDYTAISSGYATISATGRHVADLDTGTHFGEVSDHLRNGKTLTTLGAWLIRTRSLRDIGGARLWFETAEDLDIQFRLAGAGRVWHAQGIRYLYRLHDASITHVQARDRLAFYENCARTFASDRTKTGSDALMRGHPPTYHPETGTKNHAPRSANAHAAGQMTGAAWRAFQNNDLPLAARKIRHAIGLQPFSLQTWRSAAGLYLRILKRRIGLPW